MKDIDILILDEHTAALDLKIADSIMKLTDRIVREKNIIVIMVTHNLRYALEYGNRILMFHEGKVVLDKKDNDKNNFSIDEVLKIFNSISLERGNSV